MPRPIVDTLRNIRRGAFLDECSDALNQLVAHVQQTSKPGKLVLTIEIRKASVGGTALIVDGNHALKAPTLAREATVMFPDEHGDLLVEDPRQQKLELKTVDVPNANTELRTIGQE